MKFIIVVIVVVSVFTEISSYDQYKDVSNNCGNIFHLDDSDNMLYLYYRGETFSEKCIITVTTDDSRTKVCSKPEKFDLESCTTTIGYDGNYYTTQPTYTCFSKQMFTYCSESTMVITFDKTFAGPLSKTDDVELTISILDQGYSSVSPLTKVLVINFVFIAGVVIAIVCVIAVICCCMRHRDRQRRAALRAPTQVPTTATVTFAMPNQAGYQAQAGYGQPSYLQPSQQACFQQPLIGYKQPPSPMESQRPLSFSTYEKPPSPTKFHLPPGAFPSSSQQYTGHKSGISNTETSSAPTMEPPPYSG
ncbi:hypothetical protein ACF0H5_014270 [Mactra antiquata]